MVDLKTMASASESQIPEGSWVTATNVPSKPYAGSKITLIFFPKFLSSIWNMDGGSSCSGIAFAKRYNRCSIDKTLALSGIQSFPICWMSRETALVFLFFVAELFCVTI